MVSATTTTFITVPLTKHTYASITRYPASMNRESSLDPREVCMDLDIGVDDRADLIPAEAAGECPTGVWKAKERFEMYRLR